jgi:hypothetical protein
LTKHLPKTPPFSRSVHANATQNIEIKEFTAKITEINILPPHPGRNLMIPKI